MSTPVHFDLDPLERQFRAQREDAAKQARSHPKYHSDKEVRHFIDMQFRFGEMSVIGARCTAQGCNEGIAATILAGALGHAVGQVIRNFMLTYGNHPDVLEILMLNMERALDHQRMGDVHTSSAFSGTQGGNA